MDILSFLLDSTVFVTIGSWWVVLRLVLKFDLRLLLLIGTLLFKYDYKIVSYKSFDKIHESKVSPEIQVQAVTDLIRRLVPERANEFKIQIENALPEEINGYFEVGFFNFLI